MVLCTLIPFFPCVKRTQIRALRKNPIHAGSEDFLGRWLNDDCLLLCPWLTHIRLPGASWDDATLLRDISTRAIIYHQARHGIQNAYLAHHALLADAEESDEEEGTEIDMSEPIELDEDNVSALFELISDTE